MTNIIQRTYTEQNVTSLQLKKENVPMTLNARITKLALSISAEIHVKMPILVVNLQNVRPKATEQFANVQLDGEVIHQLSVSNVGYSAYYFY